MFRSVLASFLLFGLALSGCRNTDGETASSQDPGSAEATLFNRWWWCDAPVIHRADGSYARLSDTGLYCSSAFGGFDRNIRGFAPEIGLWADGADKARYIRLPPGTRIDTSDMDHWLFPVGTKVWKEFSLNGRKIETRLLEKRPDGTWLMIAFQWNQRQTDAFPVPDGVINANGTYHDIPPVAQCIECHSNVDGLVGVSALMLARANPRGLTLQELVDQRRLTRNPDRVVQFPGSPTTSNALAYLYANCSHCHRGANAPAGLQLWTSVRDQVPEDTAVYRTAVNQELTSWVDHGFTKRVDPGAPEMSGVIARMSSRTPGDQMPEIATKIVDPQGIAMVRDWILQLPR